MAKAYRCKNVLIDIERVIAVEVEKLFDYHVYLLVYFQFRDNPVKIYFNSFGDLREAEVEREKIFNLI